MDRMQGVDVMRVLAIIAVIIIHTTPFESQASLIGSRFDLGTVINQVSRFAVPFFFVISGYFWASKFESREAAFNVTVKISKRILLVFFVWSLVYLLPTNFFGSLNYGALGPLKVIYWNIVQLFDNPMSAIFQGTKSHLWFLVSLLFCLLICTILLLINVKFLFITMPLVFYGIGLAGKAYTDTPIGFHVDFNFRNGPFFGLIFFASGFFLERRNSKESWFILGLVMSGFGLFLQFVELFTLQKYWGTSMNQDYVVGTYLVGVGAALMALSDSKVLVFRPLSIAGPLVLGVYVVHFVFVDLLKPLDEWLSGANVWELVYPAAVFFLSLMTTYIMSRVPCVRRVII